MVIYNYLLINVNKKLVGCLLEVKKSTLENI